MKTVLICAAESRLADFHASLLFRQDLDLHVATRIDRALVSAVAARPHLVLVDRDFPDAERLIDSLRHDVLTRHYSIVVAAEGEMTPDEILLLEAGANAILRLPAGPEWDERLSRLLSVPTRRYARLPVQLHLTEPQSPFEWAGTVLNISANGMLVELRRELPVGAETVFAARLPEVPADVSGTARVVRAAGGRRFGLEFVALPPDAAARVRSFVSSAA